MFIAKPYDSKFDAEIRKLFTLSVAGDIQIALERHPFYWFGAEVQAESPSVHTFFTQTGELAGIYHLGSRKIRYYGEWEDIRYLSDIRIKPKFQKSRLLYEMIRHAYRQGLFHRNTMVEGIAFKSNKSIHTMIERAQKGHTLLPEMYVQEDYISTLFSSKSHFTDILKGSVKYKTCDSNDLSRLSDFYMRYIDQYRCYPFMELKHMESTYYRGLHFRDIKIIFDEKEILGMAILWDQSAFKQTVVKGYSPRMTLLRKPFNFISKIFNGIQLPEAHQNINYINLSYVLIKDMDPNYFRTLLHHISKECREISYTHILCGLASSDPLLKVFGKKVFIHQSRGTYYHLYPYNPEGHVTKPYYFDIARI